MKIFVDSSVWIDYFNGSPTPQADALDAALRHEQVLMGDLILTEVLQGFRHQRDYDVAKRLLLALPFYTMLDRDIAVQSADHYRFLRLQGITVRKTIDCLIATFCIHHNLPLLHADNDFEPFVEYFNLNIFQL